MSSEFHCLVSGLMLPFDRFLFFRFIVRSLIHSSVLSLFPMFLYLVGLLWIGGSNSSLLHKVRDLCQESCLLISCAKLFFGPIVFIYYLCLILDFLCITSKLFSVWFQIIVYMLVRNIYTLSISGAPICIIILLYIMLTLYVY